MELEEIKRYVTDWLTFSGVERKDMEVQVYEALHHLLTAMKLYDLMDAEARAFVSEFVSLRMNHFLNVKISIKTKSQERKRNKEKKIIPPDPLLKEKDKKEKAENERERVCDAVSDDDEDFKKRREAFRQQCLAYVGKYDDKRLADFFRHFSQKSQTTGKMMFEAEEYWTLENRLELWMNNRHTAEINAAERAKKSRGKQQKEQTDTKAQQEQAAQREAANARLEAQIEQSKAGAVTADEQIARNPDGILARLRREREAKENAKKTTD